VSTFNLIGIDRERENPQKKKHLERERRAEAPFLVANHTREPDAAKVRRWNTFAFMMIE
jgi:hypothetical protein